MAIPASPVVLLCPPNFVFYVESEPRGTSTVPNVESLVFAPWKYAICPDRDLNPEASDWRTCVLTMKPAIINMLQGRGGTIHRCIDIYRDTFPAIRIAILFFTIAICYYLKKKLLKKINIFVFNFCFPQWFSFRQKRYIIISTCDFCKVIPQIHSYFVKIFCEISVETN